MSSSVESTSKLFRFFFLKTTFARLALIILVAGGLLSGFNMVKEAQPDLDIPSATITTEWVEADGKTIEQSVTAKLEKKLKEVKGVSKLLSGSFQGFSVISVEFRANVPADEAMERLRAKLTEAKAELPEGAKEPILKQVRLTDVPILSIRLTGDTDIRELSELGDRLKDELEGLSGVNEATVLGKRDDIVAIRLIGARLEALSITSTDVANALEANNLNMPWGRFDGEEMGAIFRFQGRFDTIAQIENLPIARTDTGRIVPLSEVAEVRRTLAEERVRTSFSQDGQPFATAIDLSITKQSGADTIGIINNAKALMEEQRARGDWPAGIEYFIVTDESITITQDLLNVFNSGWQAMLAVFAILLISLTWREALVAGLAIPVAFGGAMIIIALLGYTLNQMVIIGLVIALGLLVDVFILMMEGLHDAMFVKGKKFSEAVVETIRAYAVPAITGTLTTVFAMAPLIGIEGTMGKFIRIMPITTIAALMSALFVALFIAVPLARYALPNAGTKVKETAVDRGAKFLSNGLVSLMKRVFVRSRVTALGWVAVAAGVFVGSFLLFSRLPIELLSKDDTQNMGVLIELEPDSSLNTAQVCADAAGDALKILPFFKSVTKYVGQKSPFSTPGLDDRVTNSTGLSFVGFTGAFTPKAERDKLAYQYEDEIRAALEPQMVNCPGGRLQLTIAVGGPSGASPVQVVLTGPDTDLLLQYATQAVDALASVEGARNVRHNQGLVALDIEATPKPEVMDFYGLSAQDMAQQVRYMLNTDTVGKYVVGGIKEDIDIRMGYAWPTRDGDLGGPTTFGETQLLNVITPSGAAVPLDELVDFNLKESALTILHRDGERSLSVSADVSDRTASEVLADFLPKLNELQNGWDAGFEYSVAGEAEESAEVFGSAGIMLGVALFFVAALLILQFDNFLQPLIILATIPLALTGTFLGFFILNQPFSFMAMVGIIALIGIVVNDSIVMIDTMNRYAKQGYSVREAAAHGGADRLRPIVTTSLTTIVGLIPLTLSSPLWMPLGITIISGLLFATILSLFVVPCLYLVFTHEGLHADSEAEVTA